MPKRSKLLRALDAHKGRDYDAEKQKKLAKAAEKRKATKKTNIGDEENKEENTVETNGKVCWNRDLKRSNQKLLTQLLACVQAESENLKSKKRNAPEDEEDEELSDNEDEEQAQGEESDKDGAGDGEDNEEDEDEEEEEEEEEEEDIPLSDLSEDEREDVVPHQRLTINNSAAISASIKRISFITSQTPFSEHNSLVSKEPIEVPDPNDDLNRELAFYKVCQAAATEARSLLKKEGIPFTRPGDYFAEMVKTDEHMSKIKKKLYDEAAAKKAAAEARKQRDLKKFGKQVQVAKLQQRQKEKRETLEKINELKKSMLSSLNTGS